MNNILYIFFSWKGNIKNCYNRITNMMSNINYEHYIIVTGGETETHIDSSNKRLYIKCNDSYEGLPEKVLETFKYLYKNKWTEKYDYFCKLDDDMIIKKIFNLEKGHVNYTGYFIKCDFVVDFEKKYKKPHPTRNWHINKCTPGSYHNKRSYTGEYTDWCGGGWGYILSTYALEKLQDEELTQESIYEDLSIALLLKKYNIIPTRTNILEWEKYIFSPEHAFTPSIKSKPKPKPKQKLKLMWG